MIMDIDKLNLEIYNLKSENNQLKKILEQRTKVYCTHCRKMFPRSNDGMVAFREHIAECDKHTQHKFFKLITKLITFCDDVDTKLEALRFIRENR